MKKKKKKKKFYFERSFEEFCAVVRDMIVVSCALTVVHVLLECNHYNVVRQRYSSVSSLYELFDTVNAQNVVGFIRDIGLYRLL